MYQDAWPYCHQKPSAREPVNLISSALNELYESIWRWHVNINHECPHYDSASSVLCFMPTTSGETSVCHPYLWIYSERKRGYCVLFLELFINKKMRCAICVSQHLTFGCDKVADGRTDCLLSALT